MIHVVAAVIRDDSSNDVLIAKRPDHVHQGGLWEFPGGKKEPGESSRQALHRELAEELGIEPVNYRPVIQIPHRYPDKAVLLDVWQVTSWTGDPHGKEGQTIRWVQPDALDDYEFPGANLGIVKAVKLPALYLITPDIRDSESEFITRLKGLLQSGIALVQYRQRRLSSSKFEQLAKRVIDACHESGAKVLLNSTPDLVQRLGADGVQLNAVQLRAIKERPLSESYLVAASCHNEAELALAEELVLDFALLSPVQKTSTHPDAEPLGWEKFARLTRNLSLPVYALGGMSKADVVRAWECGGQGISAISSLWND